MSGTSNWKNIREKRIGGDYVRVERARQALLAELNLADLRKHRKVSQTDVAKVLAVSQANVSQLERGDIKFSTLTGYVGALGGRLVMKAVFDDETVVLSGAPENARVSSGKISNIAGIGVSDKVLRRRGQHEIAARAKVRGVDQPRRRQVDGAR